MTPNEQLARYSVSGGERALCARHMRGVIYVIDQPATGTGRSYLVDCLLERDGRAAVQALVADYTNQALALDQIPLRVSVVRRTLTREAAHVRAPQPLR